jgi:hypothetical protein
MECFTEGLVVCCLVHVGACHGIGCICVLRFGQFAFLVL